jgi:transcriptional regulator GlxA family with amidase domain
MLFKKEIRTSFQEYLLDCRMQRAKHLLLDPTLRISGIAQQVGYTNPKAFSIAFHEACGIPPTEYREMRGRGSHPVRSGGHTLHILLEESSRETLLMNSSD